MRTSIGGVSVLLVGILVLSACIPDEGAAPVPTAPIVQLGGPGEANTTLSPDELDGLGETLYGEADVVFVRDMLHHHAQALVMTALVPDRSTDDDVRLMAERMDISQRDEMDRFEQWLQERGEPVRDPDAPHDAHAGMPGLLTDAEIAELEAAQGVAFDRLFLAFMTRHHEGAVTMVHDLYDAGGGLESAIDEIARHVEADQNIEITRMQQMLAARS